MAYSLPLVTPANFILRLKIHCSKCEGKVKRFLLGSPGVNPARIDAKQGTVAISATVEPSTIMMLLEKGLGLKAELLWEQIPSSQDGQDLQIVAESRMVDERFEDPNVVAQLKQLSRIKGLKTVEVSYSKTTKTIKLIFTGQNDELNEKNVEVINWDENNHPEISLAGGGLCGASTSCCSSHHHVMNRNMNNGIVGGYCCGNHPAGAAGYPIGPNVCSMHSCINGNMHWPTHACGHVLPPGPPPPWSAGYSPSAPPNWTVDYGAPHLPPPPPPPPPPPARDTSSFNQFSDENTGGGCIIM